LAKRLGVHRRRIYKWLARAIEEQAPELAALQAGDESAWRAWLARHELGPAGADQVEGAGEGGDADGDAEDGAELSVKVERARKLRVEREISELRRDAMRRDLVPRSEVIALVRAQATLEVQALGDLGAQVLAAAAAELPEAWRPLISRACREAARAIRERWAEQAQRRLERLLRAP
jgi:hypothetical protein